VRDHQRILGTLFIAWAVAQIFGVIAVAATSPEPAPPMLWLLGALAVVAYGWVGLRLRARDPRVRIASILLSALALLSFPVGTVLGFYGLWVLLRRRELPVAP
jgi:hypothetical protein